MYSTSRHKQLLRSSLIQLTPRFTRRLSSTPTPTSKLRDHYNFKPPPSSLYQNPTKTLQPNLKKPPKEKALYKPPSSLDPKTTKTLRSDLPFDFQYSYTETSRDVRPIGLREPKYSPFGPGRIDKVWTGVCAPSVDPTVRSVEGKEEDGLEKNIGGQLSKDAGLRDKLI